MTALKYTILLLLLFIPIIIYSQNSSDRKRIRKINKYIAQNFESHAPGCAILIAKKGKVLYKKGFGKANLEQAVAMQPDMVFRIGSITKTFTAIGILQLMEKNKLSLSDKLSNYFPAFQTNGKQITIENLLTHTSGIKGYEQLDAKVPNAIRVDFKAELVLDSLAKLALDFEPGTQYAYSNSNYFILGLLIEQVGGLSYPQYLKENIFKPAQLNSTFYDNPNLIIPKRVSGYAYAEKNYWNAEFISMSLVYSAGALLSSVQDLFKFHEALYSGKLISKETLQKAIAPFQLANGKPTEYGYGFFVKVENGQKSIGHGGAIDGFRAIQTYFPDQDIFISLLLNADQDGFLQLHAGITNLLLGKTMATSYKDLQLNDAILDRYVGIYTFQEDKKQFLKVYKKDNRLYADLSNGTGSNMAFLAQSESLFYLPDVRRIPTTVEFALTEGKVTGLFWTQEQKHEALKTE